MKNLLSHVLSATLGIWLATLIVPGVAVVVFPSSHFFGFPLTTQWQVFIVLGVILGLLNYFVKPLLDLISLPLRLITFGLFGVIINIVLILVVSVVFKEFVISWFWPVFWTTVVMTIVRMISSRIINREN